MFFLFKFKLKYCGLAVAAGKVYRTVMESHDLARLTEADAHAHALGGEEGNEYLLLVLGCSGDAVVAHSHLGAVGSFLFSIYHNVSHPCLDGILNQINKDAIDL